MKTVVGKRDRLGIDLHIVDIACMAIVHHALASLLEHREVDVRHDNLAVGADETGKAGREITRPRSQVEDLHATAHARQIDSDMLPETVDTE